MKLLFISLLLLVPFISMAQPKDKYVREFLLEKSKRQRTTGLILLGSGFALIGTGLLIGAHHDASFDQAVGGALVGISGTAIVLVSVPFFLASGKNKRKGNAMSASIDMERLPVFAAGGGTGVFPVLGVKVRL